VSAAVDRPNVLLTSAARKVLLVRAFKAALARCDGGAVVAADIEPLAAALYEADRGRLIPRSDAPGFVDALLALCAEERVGLVVPTRDEELPILAGARERFAAEGTLVLVSPPDAIDACRDKARFATAVREAGLLTPVVVDPATTAVAYPAFVKPRWGKGGRGAVRVDDARELGLALEAIADLGDEPVIQAYVDAPEYTIDVFIDLDGRPISCVPRERVAVMAGESVVGRTVRDPDLSADSVRLCSSLGLVGHLTVQAFRTADGPRFIEINPRYGGAANLGFEAGAPTPEFAVRMARGERLEPRLDAYEVGLVMLRHSDDLFVREAELLGGSGGVDTVRRAGGTRA
jgi:carbamoyl-phosphate synthase large subunit